MVSTTVFNFCSIFSQLRELAQFEKRKNVTKFEAPKGLVEMIVTVNSRYPYVVTLMANDDLGYCTCFWRRKCCSSITYYLNHFFNIVRSDLKTENFAFKIRSFKY